MDIKKYNQIIDEVYNKYATKYMGYDDVPSKELFLFEIKNNPEFSEKWGLKIEERDLTTVRERKKYDDDLFGEYPDHHETLEYIFKRGVPRKLITITYNDKTIESYE